MRRLSGQFLVFYIYGWYIQTLDLISYDLKRSRPDVPCYVYVTRQRCVSTTEATTGATLKGQTVHPRGVLFDA